MFGIVLWKNASTGKALVWCEDQKDLALLDQRNLHENLMPNIAVDDQILFELEPDSAVRKISKVLDFWAPTGKMSLTDTLLPQLALKAS